MTMQNRQSSRFVYDEWCPRFGKLSVYLVLHLQALGTELLDIGARTNRHGTIFTLIP